MKEAFHIQWHLTNQCNLRCRHCYQDDFSKECDLGMAGLERIAENILDAMRSLNRKLFVHLTGGEPFLKPELFPLLGKLNHEPSVEELGIITNGTLLNEEVVSRLKGFSKLKKMKISLDGADPETNDGIRSPGTFKRILQNLSLLKKDRTFEIIFMFTLMRRNYRNLPSFILLCQDLGVDGMILERFIPLGNGREVRDQVLGREEWKEVVMNFLEDCKPHPYQAFEILFKDDEMEFLGAPCVIGRDGLCIMPDGTVFPCRRFPIPIGNLAERPLTEIWKGSEILKQLRNKRNIKGRCGRCELRDCMGCRSLALSLTGDYLAEDPHCCRCSIS